MERIAFDPEEDELWFVGDLVNGGAQSREVVQWVRDQAESATVCLGNHDLHMLAVWCGAHAGREKDTFGDLLGAPDADELCRWLQHRNILHRSDNLAVVHAAIWPWWTLAKAEEVARELESALHVDDPRPFFDEMYGNDPRAWRDDLSGHDRSRFAVNVFTRARCLTDDRELDFDHKGTLEQLPSGLEAWFDVHARTSDDGARYFFGHWSALGLRLRPRAVCLDTGVRWGRRLTALRLDDGALFSVPQNAAPG
jgi:bis(5'-nucleosyl)-tetraphosphatase (symmetrical)